MQITTYRYLAYVDLSRLSFSIYVIVLSNYYLRLYISIAHIISLFEIRYFDAEGFYLFTN